MRRHIKKKKVGGYQSKLEKEQKILEEILRETPEEKAKWIKKFGGIVYTPSPKEQAKWKKKKGVYIHLPDGRVAFTDKLVLSSEGTIKRKKIPGTALGPFYNVETGKPLTGKDAKKIVKLLDKKLKRKRRILRVVKRRET